MAAAVVAVAAAVGGQAAEIRVEAQQAAARPAVAPLVGGPLAAAPLAAARPAEGPPAEGPPAAERPAARERVRSPPSRSAMEVLMRRGIGYSLVLVSILA